MKDVKWRTWKLFGNNLQEGSMFLILYIAVFSIIGATLVYLARYFQG
jgi:hypothetical protein